MPDVIWHAEKPLIRTAPAPLFLLSGLVRENNFKVVLTGEGADEILGGYDLFRETKIRRFWARNPQSKFRSLLLKKLYPYIPNWPNRAPAYLEAFYRTHLEKTAENCYSHFPRWTTTARTKLFFSPELKNELKGYESLKQIEAILPGNFSTWGSLEKAQYLEMITLLSGNLLCSQGDRMMMGHSVEGRFPFLDYRVMELCASMPTGLKIKKLKEKFILQEIARPYLPQSISARTKQAYRAPDSASFFDEQGHPLDYVEDLISEENIRRSGYFNYTSVKNLVNKCRNSDFSLLGTKDNIAIVGIITTLLLDKMFIRDWNSRVPMDDNNQEVFIAS